MPGLRRNHDARTAGRDDVAEFLEHQRRAVQINLENGLRGGLARGHAGGMDETADLTDASRLLDERQEDVLAGAHAAQLPGRSIPLR